VIVKNDTAVIASKYKWNILFYLRFNFEFVVIVDEFSIY